MNNNKFNTLNDREWLRLTGIKKSTFNKMLDILKVAEIEKFKKGGKTNKLSLENRLLMTLLYWREYQTYFHLGKSFDISEANCYRNIKWIEDILIKNSDFQQLAGKKALINDYFNDKTIIIDATETPIQRPKKGQKQSYSGKKKKHTIKTQVIIEQETKKNIATSFSLGKKHDYALFKESKIPILKNTKLIVDSGYQGIQKNHNNVLIPTKKTKKNPLNKEQKQYNRLVSKMRIIIENIFAILKKFKIITEKYRNRRKRFGLRFNLIASIYNLQLLYLT
ncbi:IS5 family transposase [Spiroplasma poulsonii]|uniref:IS5 family transposase n=1 Tax=Spiroplasma poulsonii TaxID=2138 RepID=A0A3S0SKY0_9MOLU|nr:IS5 family transposase [Spiroplasma poulsonii]MBW3058538.1 IS5/IS1182 family transposase [Spiroplasma poulsonii]MBW3058907.1 IS5/IS1182 family transposase [Spiroplasma poulsonii]RUP76256.1 IS5 family transposase [Spiroplasma poulsonii]